MYKSNLIRFLVFLLRVYYINIAPNFIWNSKKRAISGINIINDGKVRFPSKYYAALVYYEPDGRVSLSIRNLIKELNGSFANIILISNLPLSGDQEYYFKNNTHSIIIRNNIGYDFGAYKDVILHFIDKNIEVDRFAFMNDSVYYFSKGLDKLVGGLFPSQEETPDIVASFENQQFNAGVHFQSFALSVSGKVIAARAFQEFWRSYGPFSNRLYAIEKGEKGLSRALLKSAASSIVLYNIASITRQIEQDGLEDTDFSTVAISVSRPLRGEIETMYEPLSTSFGRERVWYLSDGQGDWKISDTEKQQKIDKVALGKAVGATVAQASPIHSGFIFFSKLLENPMVKKDLLFRSQYSLYELELLLRGVYKDEEVDEYLHMVRKKGDIFFLTAWERLKVHAGAL